MVRQLVRSVLVASITTSSAAALAQDAPPAAPSPEAAAQPAAPPQAPPPAYPPPAYPPPAYPPAYAPAYPPGYGPYVAAPALPGVHQHDGVFVRLLVGGGYNNMSTTVQGQDVSLYGGGGAFSIAVGGALNRHLILFGEITNSVAVDPNFKIEGGRSGSNNGSVSMVGFGGGLAYYTDANVYLSGSLLLSQLQFNDDDGSSSDAHTDFGVGINALIGKEWWVSDNWGLGIAGQLLAATMKDQSTAGFSETPTWTALSLNVLFTASFN